MGSWEVCQGTTSPGGGRYEDEGGGCLASSNTKRRDVGQHPFCNTMYVQRWRKFWAQFSSPKIHLVQFCTHIIMREFLRGKGAFRRPPRTPALRLSVTGKGAPPSLRDASTDRPIPACVETARAPPRTHLPLRPYEGPGGHPFGSSERGGGAREKAKDKGI